MIKILLLMLFPISVNVMGFECFGPDKYQWSLKQNFDKADVAFFGNVIKGTALPDDESVIFDVAVSLSIKGNPKGLLQLSTGKSYMHPKVELSGNYLFFLYGDNEIEMCDPIYNVHYEIGSIEELDELSRRGDLQISKLFAEILNYIE